MSREIRRVPPHWEHPKDDRGQYRPMYQKSYKKAAEEWLSNAILWSQGKHPEQKPEYTYWWEWSSSPPDKEYYAPYEESETTWFQLYEDVSEGTPITPPFETKAELVDYLVEHGDFWKGEPWDRKRAEKMVEQGWVPSGVFTDGKFYASEETLDLKD